MEPSPPASSHNPLILAADEGGLYPTDSLQKILFHCELMYIRCERKFMLAVSTLQQQSLVSTTCFNKVDFGMTPHDSCMHVQKMLGPQNFFYPPPTHTHTRIPFD